MTASPMVKASESDAALATIETIAERVLAGDLGAARRLARMVLAQSADLRSGGVLPVAWVPNPWMAEVEVTGRDGTVLAASSAVVDPARPRGHVEIDVPFFGQPEVEVAMTEDENGQRGFDLFASDRSVPMAATISTPPVLETSLRPSPVGTQIPGRARFLAESGPSLTGRPGWQVSPVNNPGGTSQAMFAKVLKSDGLANRLLWLFHDHQATGLMDDDAEVLLDLTHQSVSACRRGLVIQGYLKDSGQRRLTRKGRNSATVWVLTEQAQARIASGLEKRPASV